MDREVIWSFLATGDLESIVEHIARDSEYYAAAMSRQLLTAAASLTRFSERGRIVPEYDDPAIRELIIGPYRLIYRVRPDRVEIARIIHGARQMVRLD